MASKLSKSDFGPEHFQLSDDLRARALTAEHAYVLTRNELAVRFGNNSSLDEAFRLSVDLEDRMQSQDMDLVSSHSPVLDFAMSVARRKQAWENIDAAMPTHTQTWFMLDTGLNMLRLSGRLATAKYVDWRLEKFVPFLEKLEDDNTVYINNINRQNQHMLEEAKRNRVVASPSVLAHVGIADLPVH